MSLKRHFFVLVSDPHCDLISWLVDDGVEILSVFDWKTADWLWVINLLVGLLTTVFSVAVYVAGIDMGGCFSETWVGKDFKGDGRGPCESTERNSETLSIVGSWNGIRTRQICRRNRIVDCSQEAGMRFAASANVRWITLRLTAPCRSLGLARLSSLYVLPLFNFPF